MPGPAKFPARARLLLFCAAAAALLPLAAWRMAGGDHAGANTGYRWPEHFTIAAAQVGTATHSLAVAWSGEFNADTGAKARVLPAPNSYARAEWLASGEARLSLYQPSDYFRQMDAVGGYATRLGGPADTRVINVNLVSPWGYMVRGDSRIHSIADIGPGTRIAYTDASPIVIAGVEALLALAGLAREEVKLVKVGSYAANTRAVAEGRADVAFTSPLSGTSVEAEAAPAGIRWLEIPRGHENFAAYRALQPGYVLRRTRSGVKSARGVLMDHAVQTNHVRSGEDAVFVYRLLKWMDEHHGAYAEKYVHAPMMSLANLVDYLEAGALEPLHEGAIRYLEEKGFWKPEYQKRQDSLVAIAQRRSQAWRAALRAAGERGIEALPGNDDWRKLWQEERRRYGISGMIGEEILALARISGLEQAQPQASP